MDIFMKVLFDGSLCMTIYRWISSTASFAMDLEVGLFIDPSLARMMYSWISINDYVLNGSGNDDLRMVL
jgi:hypothetical protein